MAPFVRPPPSVGLRLGSHSDTNESGHKATSNESSAGKKHVSSGLALSVLRYPPSRRVGRLKIPPRGWAAGMLKVLISALCYASIAREGMNARLELVLIEYEVVEGSMIHFSNP